MMATLHQKIHRVLQNRDSVIMLTVLAGMLTNQVVFLFDYSYYVHYTIGFTRSFFFFVLCYLAIYLTASLRLLGLMFIVIISMGADFLSIISTEMYYVMKPYRYEDEVEVYGVTVNFITFYRIYEVFCVLFTFIYWIVNYISSPSRRTTHSSGAGNVFASQSNRICQSQESRKNC